MATSIHNFKVQDLTGNEVDLSDFKGKVLLIVNTASKCGYTPQLGELEELYKEYKPKGLEILAFPSNDFKEQEPLDGEAIGQFCQKNYGVSFPVMDKIHVKGKDKAEVYKFLSKKKWLGLFSSEPKWNFHKFLVDKDGKVVDFFYTVTKPNSPKIKKAIDKIL